MVGKQTRHLVAIMFTDVAGYTALMQRDEQKARQVRDRHRAVLKDVLAPHRGELLEHYGDGSLSIFASAIEAVHCALEIQKILSAPPVVPLRIGIHTGDVVREDQGVYGDGVNVASRIQSMCPPSEVFISGKVFDDVKNQPGLCTRSLGRVDLKNVSRPMAVFAVTDERHLPSSQRGESTRLPQVAGRPANVANGQKSIAVLPFLNMSGDEENEYFSDGIAEEIISSLTRVEGLQVTARTSSFAFKGKATDIRQVGSLLNVGHVLEGSVRKSGGRVRITAQLIDTDTGYHVFADVYDRIIEDIFDTQDEIAHKIAEKLRASLPGTAGESLVRSRTKDPETYNLYLRGRFFMSQWDAAGVERALDYFERAVARDPGFAAAYGGLAYAYTFLLVLGHMGNEEGVGPAREAAARAEELDSEGSEGPAALAYIRMFLDWDIEAAGAAMRKALARSPGSAKLHYDYAFVMRAIGDLDGAIAALETATSLDPLASLYNNALANDYTSAGRFDDAAERFERTLDMDPDFFLALEGRGWLDLHRGNLPTAIDTFRSLRIANSGSEKALGSLGFACGLAGHTDDARECLDELRQWQVDGHGVNVSFELALVHAGLGEFDEAFRYLDEGVEQRDSSLLFVATSVRGWGGLREDPRFQDLLRKIGPIH
jgi:TolB-like protein/Flp pilus assembly protein TadD